MKIFISMPKNEVTKTFVTERALKKLEEFGEVSRNQTAHDLSEAELIEAACDADIILCGWGTVKFTNELTDKLPNLKIIAYTGGSMANVIDEDVCKKGLKALTGNYIFAKSVAEGCLTYTLCALRELEKYINIVRSGNWRGDTWKNRGLFGKKIGLIGFGEIAKNFTLMLKPFDAEILINSGHISDDEALKYGASLASREEIFSECDIVSLHLASTPKNKGCITRELMNMMKPDALFVNTARGEIVDEKAMEELLANKRFFAALDVFSQEPLPENSKLRTLENVLLIPHMGGPTIDMREYITMSFVKDFVLFEKGEKMINEIEISAVKHMSGKH